jgi:hypothetical protein
MFCGMRHRYAFGLANGLVLVQQMTGGVVAEEGKAPYSLTFRPHPTGLSAIDAKWEAGKLVLYTGCENGEVAAWEVGDGRCKFR